MFGDPTFVDTTSALAVMREFITNILADEHHNIDPSTLGPHQLVRLIGSKNKSGRYCIAMSGDEFMAETPEHILERSIQFEPFKIPNNNFSIDPFLATEMAAAVDLIEHTKMKKTSDGKCTTSAAFRAAWIGVSEGEVWHGLHCGRNKAAFVVACHLLRDVKNNSDIETQLQEWNKRNDPPLANKELETCLKSARNTVKKEINVHYSISKRSFGGSKAQYYAASQ